MAKRKKDTGSAKRFGARYGRTIRLKVAKAESGYKKRQKCPYCKHQGVKRQAAGIWHCTKCSSTFTGKAYSLA